MKVLLEQDVPKLGRSGQILEVAEAYGRNFLLPKRLARVATADQIAKSAAESKRRQQTAAKRQSNWQAARAGLANQTIELSASANPQGKLFASLKADAIRDHVRAVYHLDLSEVRLSPDHWKTTGQHSVTLRWPDGAEQSLTLIINHG